MRELYGHRRHTSSCICMYIYIYLHTCSVDVLMSSDAVAFRFSSHYGWPVITFFLMELYTRHSNLRPSWNCAWPLYLHSFSKSSSLRRLKSQSGARWCRDCPWPPITSESNASVMKALVVALPSPQTATTTSAERRMCSRVVDLNSMRAGNWSAACTTPSEKRWWQAIHAMHASIEIEKVRDGGRISRNGSFQYTYYTRHISTIRCILGSFESTIMSWNSQANK